jgi:predicted porin
MKKFCVTQRFLGPLAAGGLLAALAAPAGAVDITSSDGAWTFSASGEINVSYIFSHCESESSAVTVAGGLACTGTASGNSVSNIGNGLLPASIAFGFKTTQNGIDLSAHFGLFPGIATNDGGSPNLQAVEGPTNTALGTTSLDIRQVYITFGTKDAGTVLAGRNIGLFGADVILNDMTLPGVGGPGSAAGPAPSNTTLGGIGLGYIYTDWLAQIDYTTPDLSGFQATVGVYDPLNSLTDTGVSDPKKAPGFHAKLTLTLPFSDTMKFYGSVAGITQKMYQDTTPVGGPVSTYNYNASGVDVFLRLDVSDLEVFGYYYHGDGLGTTALFNLGTFADGQKRKSDGYLAQITYKIGTVKLGVNYGESKLDYANSADAAANPALVQSNKKATGGIYWSLTKNLMLLSEFSNVKSQNHSGGENSANTFNVGFYLGF